jgi:hypothetical protein
MANPDEAFALFKPKAGANQQAMTNGGVLDGRVFSWDHRSRTTDRQFQ